MAGRRRRLLVHLILAAGLTLYVCLLLNNLGATTMMELLIANRKIRQILRREGISVHDTLMGSYCTSQEMAGLSISMMRLDAELKRHYDMPAESLAFTKV